MNVAAHPKSIFTSDRVLDVMAERSASKGRSQAKGET